MKTESKIYIGLVNQILVNTKHTIDTISEIISIPKSKLIKGSIFTSEEEKRLVLLSKVLNK